MLNLNLPIFFNFFKNNIFFKSINFPSAFSSPPRSLVPESNFRITENGNFRITENGNFRITE